MKADHKAAKVYSDSGRLDVTQIRNLKAAYIELRELAKAVLKVADRDTDVFNALHAAIGEE